MDLEVIKKITLPYLQERNYSLYSLQLKKEYGLNIVEILVDSEEFMNIDELVDINNYISNELENYDQLWEEYNLEVSSAGAEKELKSLEQVTKYISYYVHLETSEHKIEGKLENVIDNVLHVKVNLKGRMKIYKIIYDEISFIRLAVHI